MKLVKKNTKADPELRDDPRPKDTVMWNRLRLMVEEEACDRAWGCALYRLHRTGWITTEHREAGDEYQRIVLDYVETQKRDPDEEPEDELLPRRIERAKTRYREAIDVLGLGRNVVDWLILQDNHLTEREKYIARDALQLLANYLHSGNKIATRGRRNVV
jgi:hypothetical protein